MDYLLNGLKRSKAIRGFDIIEPATPASVGRVLVWVNATIADTKLAELRRAVEDRAAESGTAWDIEVAVRVEHLRVSPRAPGDDADADR